MVSENWGIYLVSALLGGILYEIRQLRIDVKSCVPDKQCRIMMKEHDKRISKLEEDKR